MTYLIDFLIFKGMKKHQIKKIKNKKQIGYTLN
jgi:hypothetical protein